MGLELLTDKCVLRNGFWLLIGRGEDHVIPLLASDWLPGWCRHWPKAHVYHLSVRSFENMTSNSVDPWSAVASDWSRQITWPEHWPLIGQVAPLPVSANCHGLQDLFGKEKRKESIDSVSAQKFYSSCLATCEEFFVSEEIIILLVLMSSNQTYRRLWHFLPVFAKLMFSLNGIQDIKTHLFSTLIGLSDNGRHRYSSHKTCCWCW